MKFGVREICDVVLKAKSNLKIGSKTFKAGEPVIYFDTAKTSGLEGAATTVYATGGKGNSRLIAWEGEKTVTFTLEDALMSPLGFSILSGAGLVNASAGKKIVVHKNAILPATVTASKATVDLTSVIPTGATLVAGTALNNKVFGFTLDGSGSMAEQLGTGVTTDKNVEFTIPAGVTVGNGGMVLVDFYVEVTSKATQLEITPDKFAGNYYLEAATLFRRQEDGVDMEAQFIIPNVKIQSAFNFTMAASGDPSTFTFTMDAFPDYLNSDRSKKVLFALQIVEDQEYTLK